VTDQFGQAQTARLWEEYLLPKYPDSPFLLLRIGDVRRAFGSLALACEAYESVSLSLQRLLTMDGILNTWYLTGTKIRGHWGRPGI